MTDKEKDLVLESLKMSYMIAEQVGNRRKKLTIGRLINKLRYDKATIQQ